MFSKFPTRLIAAWIVLAIAMVLLTLSVTYAQSVSIIRNDSKVTFKYKSNDKSKSQDIDTTFTAKDDDEFYAVMKSISDANNLNLSLVNDREDREFKGGKGKTFTYRMAVNSSDDHKKSKKKSAGKKGDCKDVNIEISHSMKDLEVAMRELEERMEELRIEMSMNDDDEFRNMDIRFSYPPMPPMPPMNFSDDGEHVEIHVDKDGKETKIIRKFDDDEINIPDSLDNEDHVIVFGDKNEQAPELEKVITTENGKQIFIYRRKR